MISLPHDALRGVTFSGGERLTLRDGTVLVADIYRPVATPQNPGPWPVLLMRQPYGRDIASTVVYAHPSWFARQGFLVVVQDVRGRGDSSGEFYAFRHEEQDGYETVLWAARLPGSNGRVGMYGFSYQASTQLLAALGRPEPLKALAPHMTAFDLHSGWFYRGGLLQLSTSVTWANQMLREDAKRKDPAAYEALEASWQNSGRLSTLLPTAGLPPFAAESLPSYGRDWLNHRDYEPYWREFDLLRRSADLDLPMFHLSGWYDLYLRGSVDGYRRMSAEHDHQFLLASPWVHIPWGRLQGGVDFGPAAEPNVDVMLAAWFHYWLDHPTPVGAPPFSGCRYFVLGANAWREAPYWPPPAVRTSWFLASAGRANACFGDGELHPTTPSGPDDLFNYDPEVPVLAPGGNHGGQAAFGPHDLAAQQQGNNLLVYTSPPLRETTILAGDPVCHLFVQSSAEETAFVARLSRVTPNGKATFLTLAAASVAAQRGAELTLHFDPIAVQFEPGDRIRLDVASSAFPLLIRHPNRPIDPAHVSSPADFRRALQIVRHDNLHPSRLELPILT